MCWYWRRWEYRVPGGSFVVLFGWRLEFRVASELFRSSASSSALQIPGPTPTFPKELRGDMTSLAAYLEICRYCLQPIS